MKKEIKIFTDGAVLEIHGKAVGEQFYFMGIMKIFIWVRKIDYK